jgi:hypothetical protein
MPLPPILAGPILRRVEPNLISVWIALSEAATIKLTLWDGPAAPSSANSLITGPDPAVQTIRLGDKFHLAVVTLKTVAGSSQTLLPNRIYSYDLTLQTQSGRTENLHSLKLLTDDPINGHPHLALGYETGLLPSFTLPPVELTDLRLVHGSCRRPSFDSPDGLAWVDDLIIEARLDPSTYALKRPHQLMLSGDQIYADDVLLPQLHMLTEFSKTLIGSRRDTFDELLPIEQLKVGGKLWSADLINFPEGQRDRLILDEARMTSTDGHSHVMSFGEYCALYIFTWSNVCWPAEFPKLDLFLPPFAWVGLIPAELRSKVTPPEPLKLPDEFTDAKDKELAKEEIEKRKRSYERSIELLRTFLSTLPKVRRALANTPTYMIFDDHDVSDDWYLNPIWRDRVLTSPLGRTIVRNGLLSYALFQGWGNDPVKFESGDYKRLLELTAQLFPAGAQAGPDEVAGDQIDKLLGLDLPSGLESTDPPIKWHYSVPGPKHLLVALDNRTRRSYLSRIGPPGNVSVTVQREQIPAGPPPAGVEVLIVIAPLPVIGPPIFDELIAPMAYRVFDLKSHSDLERFSGTKGMIGTNPDAVEAWAFDPISLEALLKRVEPYRRVVFLSGDVHYGTSNAMSYWKKGDTEPARFAQLTSSGFRNVMPWYISFLDRSLSFMQRLIRAKIGAERIGWNSVSTDPLRIPADAEVTPALHAKLKKEPVMIPSEGWPQGVSINPANQPDWSWRIHVISDQRADNERPIPAQPESLGVADVSVNLDGYRRVARRHAGQLENLNNSRQFLFNSNLGLVTFQKRTETINGNQEEILDITHALYTTHPDAANPAKAEPYIVHVIPMRAPLEPKPEERLR